MPSSPPPLPLFHSVGGNFLAKSPPKPGRTLKGARRSSIRLRGKSTVEPYPEEREQMLRVDGFGDVVGSTSIDALFLVALHRFRSEREDREIAIFVHGTDPAHRLVAVHVRHH